ncbi:MAG: hypothetical protein M3Y54_20705, partial [Bacteroidota bacterium]|nr:hypothetical protein [Bacteroidota bacterium]
MFNFSSLPLPAAGVRTLLALLLLTLRLPAAAQAPAWQSARAVAAATAAASFANSLVSATAVDAAGNVFLAGQFTDTVVLGGITLSSLGDHDVFVTKFNPTINQFVWAQRAGGPGADVARALAVSGTSVYVAGDFGSTTAGFGATTLTNTDFRSSDIFVAKLTDAGSTGSFVWAKQAGGTAYDHATALAVSGTSLYVAGSFSSSAMSCGAIILTNTGSINSFDAFVAKLSDTGNTGSFVWAQRAGGTGNDYAAALAVSATRVYMAGYFNSSTATFGPVTLTNASASNPNDVFVSQLIDAGSTGSFVWVQQAGGTQATALAVSGTSVYVAGYFDGTTASFGATTLTNTASNSSDIFVAKLIDLGSSGSFVWAQRAGGPGFDRADALAVSGTSIYVAGGFSGPTAAFGSTSLTNVGFSDVFVAKLTDAGTLASFVWAQQAGGTSDEYANTLAVSGVNVYVAGLFFSSSATFGAITLSGSSSNLGFLASLTDPTLTATTAPTGPREPATLFPNPARRTATLRLPAGTALAPLTLTDALG